MEDGAIISMVALPLYGAIISMVEDGAIISMAALPLYIWSYNIYGGTALVWLPNLSL